MHVLQKLVESPYTALAIAVVLGALALSGRLSVTVSQFLLVVAWAIAVLGLREQPLPIFIGAAAIVAGVLVIVGYYFRPAPAPPLWLVKSEVEMDPVVLIGTKTDGSGLGAVGLYVSKEAAYDAVMSGDLPNDCNYSVMTPEMNTTMVPRVITLR